LLLAHVHGVESNLASELDAVDALWHLPRIPVAAAANIKFSGNFGRKDGCVAEAPRRIVQLIFSRDAMDESLWCKSKAEKGEPRTKNAAS